MVVKLGRVSHEATQHSDVAMTIPRTDENPSKGARHVLSAVPSFTTTFGAWWRKSSSRARWERHGDVALVTGSAGTSSITLTLYRVGQAGKALSIGLTAAGVLWSFSGCTQGVGQDRTPLA